MDYDGFVRVVQEGARVDRDQAERAIEATLQTLAERIAAGEARDLADELPPELGPWLGTTGGPEPFDVDEFLRRVAERESTDPETAERHAGAVFAALGQAVSPKELADMAAQLPKDFSRLLPRAPDVEGLPADEFVLRVAVRAGLETEQAQRATDAALETLAERIAGGEVEDLVSHLPARLHAPLQRGLAHTGEQARRMSLEEFLRRAAEREGASVEQALEHARAVLSTLREAVGDEEFYDVTVQLPSDYEQVLAR